MARHGIQIEREYESVPLLYLDKHKSLQVIINLISNAKHALTDSDNAEKILYIMYWYRSVRSFIKTLPMGDQ